jgi:hypothetical protein
MCNKGARRVGIKNNEQNFGVRLGAIENAQEMRFLIES